MGIARVPDPRVSRLAELFNPKKQTLATVEYVDVPGVAKGEGQALVDLPALRGVDALVHVVRAFESESVPHPDGSVDPLRDAKMLELELILADLATVERRLERLEANIKKADKAEDVSERALFRAPEAGARGGDAAARGRAPEDEQARLRGFALLSGKPMLLVANLGEAARSARRAAGSSARASRPSRASPGSGSARSRRRSRPRWPSSRPRTRRRSATTSGSPSPASTA